MKNKMDIRKAMESNLSGLRMTNLHKAAIREKIREGEKMKKKLPVTIIFAVILIFISVTALALSNWGSIKEYLKTVRFLSYQVIEWNLKEKMELVEAMYKANLIEDSNAYKQLQDENLSDAEKEAICEEIIEARYGKNWYYLGSIEDFEWPVEMRRQSEESMREYDMWSDQVDEAWDEVNPYRVEVRIEEVTGEELTALFLEKLEKEWGMASDSINPEAIHVKAFPEANCLRVTYMVSAEHPGQYDPGLHTAPSWYSVPRDIAGNALEDAQKPMTMMERMAMLQEPAESYTFTWITDLCGNERSFLPWGMEKEMIRHMSSRLTEIEGFEYGSFNPSLFQVWFDESLNLWVASYTITEENPGLYEQMMDEIERGEPQMTMMEYMARQEGKKESYTFYCYYDQFDFMVNNEDVGKPKENRLNYEPPISGKKAEDIARHALDEKYPITLAELEALKTSTALYTEQNGSHEYYIEFIGYEYSEQLARVWSYAARVNPETGEVLAAIKRDEWNQITGRKLTEDASPEVQQIVWQNNMQDALRRAMGDDSGDGWYFNWNEAGEYFYNWPLEEKAAYSRKNKPLIDQFLLENPEYAEMLQKRYDAGESGFPVYYETTRHVYGLPDEKAISQDAAQAIGYQAILDQFGLDGDVLASARVVNVYYDVTDPQKPLWKFFYNTMTDETGPEEAWGYFVSINAYTEEIESCYERWIGMPMIDLM